MKIIISPAKKMKVDTDSLLWKDLPDFLPQTEQLLAHLKEKTPEEMKKLWKCNDDILALNVRRLETMDLRQNLTPAVLSYEGIQYRYMAPGVFTDREFAYVQAHLRILSGFYGLLRPFDGVTPYRLEMQAKLRNQKGRDLYEFWGDALAQKLFSETDCILNLASKEYSICVSRYLPENVRFVTCIFGERINGRIVEKGTMCKMARGEMVRFLARNQIETAEDCRGFASLGYRFDSAESDGKKFVFIKDATDS